MDWLREPIRSCFKILLQTAQRSGEVASMSWENIDSESRTWTIPGERTKNGKSHCVPLSPMVVGTLRNLKCSDVRASKYVISNPLDRSKPMSYIRNATERLRSFSGVNFAAHDLRRTAATQMASAGVPRMTIAKILNHTDRGIIAIYERYSYEKDNGRHWKNGRKLSNQS